MTAKLSLTELKNTCPLNQMLSLSRIIAGLYKKVPTVKEYYQSSLLGDDAAILEKYKDIVNAEF